MRLFWPTVDMLLEPPPWSPPLGLCLRPSWFPCLGPLPASATLDTDALAVRGGAGGQGVVFQQGPREPEVAVFTFEGGDLETELAIQGRRPVALLFRGRVRLAGRVDARAAGARAGGPGLGSASGTGGGFGGAGGAAGTGCGSGAAYGLAAGLDVGSGGQSGDGAGAAGGGAVQIGAEGSLSLGRLVLDVAGAPGGAADRGVAGGGGSGGAIVLHGARVRLDRATRLCARGGAGGAGRGGASGGGGGGGGFVLGLSDAARHFDPHGARFQTGGGPGGPSAAGRPGAPGGRGVVFLAALRGHRPATARRVPARDVFPAGSEHGDLGNRPSQLASGPNR